MIAIVLLYVGAVLFCNGLWLLEKISDREISVINLFAGGTIVVVSVITMTIADRQGDIGLAAFSAEILLFAFTYLWVAFNQFLGADGRGLGWFCFFVAFTAAPTAAIVLAGANGDVWLTWLGFNWAAWAVLWFMYWGLLYAQWPIKKVTGYVTTVEGILTAWLPAYLVMMGYVTLPS